MSARRKWTVRRKQLLSRKVLIQVALCPTKPTIWPVLLILKKTDGWQKQNSKTKHRTATANWGPVYTTPDKYLHGEPQLQEQVFTRSRRSFSSCPHDIRNTRVSWLFSGRNTRLRPKFFAWKAAARASAILSLTIMLDFPGYLVYTYTGTCVNLSGEKFPHLWSRRNSSTDRSANLQELLRIRVDRMPNRRDISPDKYLPGVV